MASTWILTTGECIANLIEATATIGGTITVIAVTPSVLAVGGVDTIIHIPAAENVPAGAYADVVVGLLADAKGDIVLAANRPAERSFAGAAAAALVPPVVVGATSVSTKGAEITRYGGLTNETATFKGAVLIFEGGATPEAGGSATQTHEGAPMGTAVVNVQPVGSGPTNLVAAHRIASCGRGFRAEENLGLARTLAEALSVEIACSCPLAEGTAWLSRDRYVGVSGVHVAPDVYVALGISGQVQYISGMADSKVVVAVNNGANAPIFRISGYGIVGDTYDVVPTLTAALS